MTLKKLLVVGAIVGGASCSVANDNPLANLVADHKSRSANVHNPISLAAVGLVKEGELNLSFTLTNVSSTSLHVYPESLPWGNTHSIQWVALTTDGHVLPLGYLIDDPAPADKVDLHPNQTLTGTYNLSRMLIREKVPADSDLAILWIYRMRDDTIDGKAKESVSTGVAVLHTPK